MYFKYIHKHNDSIINLLGLRYVMLYENDLDVG